MVSLNLLFEHDFSLSPWQAAELVWSRFINVHGLPGKSIPYVLLWSKVISTIGKVLGVIGPVLENFDEENKVSRHSGSHRTASIHNDMAIPSKELKTVFSETPGHQHVSVRAPLNRNVHLNEIEQ